MASPTIVIPLESNKPFKAIITKKPIIPYRITNINKPKEAIISTQYEFKFVKNVFISFFPIGSESVSISFIGPVSISS